jgi:hypothetical protein
MERVGTVLSRAQSKPSTELQPNGPSYAGSIPQASDGARRAARVWRAMTELYGTAFKAAYGENPPPIWERSIAELTDEQCRDGLNRLAREKRDYPPNLTVFLDACVPKSEGVRYLGRPISEEERMALLPPPDKLAKPEVVDSWIAKLRARLGR